jgi:hypothetical protein
VIGSYRNSRLATTTTTRTKYQQRRRKDECDVDIPVELRTARPPAKRSLRHDSSVTSFSCPCVACRAVPCRAVPCRGVPCRAVALVFALMLFPHRIFDVVQYSAPLSLASGFSHRDLLCRSSIIEISVGRLFASKNQRQPNNL